ncbi:hypothetical protein DIPPA_26687 [Diplonema papillatum]|nr:hypothetical protein DIPPA_26687 [Diplonema papillatum]
MPAAKRPLSEPSTDAKSKRAATAAAKKELFAAIAAGDVARVRAAAKEDRGRPATTPLMAACLASINTVGMVKALLAEGARTTVPGGSSVLLYCIENGGTPEVCQAMVDHSGYNGNKQLVWPLSAVGGRGSALHEAVWAGNIPVVAHVLRRVSIANASLIPAFNQWPARSKHNPYDVLRKLFLPWGSSESWLAASFARSERHGYFSYSFIAGGGPEALEIFEKLDEKKTWEACWNGGGATRDFLRPFAALHVKEKTWTERAKFLRPILVHRFNRACRPSSTPVLKIDSLTPDVLRIIAQYLYIFGKEEPEPQSIHVCDDDDDDWGASECIVSLEYIMDWGRRESARERANLRALRGQLPSHRQRYDDSDYDELMELLPWAATAAVRKELFAAIAAGNVARVRAAAKEDCGWPATTPLMAASLAPTNAVDMVKALLAEGATTVVPGGKTSPVLHCIENGGTPEVCQAMVDHSRLTWPTYAIGDRGSALHEAIWAGNIPVVAHVLRRVSISDASLIPAFKQWPARSKHDPYDVLRKLFLPWGSPVSWLAANFARSERHGYFSYSFIARGGLEALPIFLQLNRKTTLEVCWNRGRATRDFLRPFAALHVKEKTWDERAKFLRPILVHRFNRACRPSSTPVLKIDCLTPDVLRIIAQYLYVFKREEQPKLQNDYVCEEDEACFYAWLDISMRRPRRKATG